MAAVKPNPLYLSLQELLATNGNNLTVPWSGLVFRATSLDYPTPAEILSGTGSLRCGGR